jgi:hypothetical protein
MPTLSEKDNFMRLANREVPEYIPIYNLFWAFNMPPFLFGTRNEDGSGKDIFGVEQVMDSAGIVPAAMPKTSDFILTDITKWRDVIKFPDFDLSPSAWEGYAAEAHKNRNPDAPFGGGTTMGFFQPLVSFMGFTEGLSACFEEPEEVKALMEYLCDFAVTTAKDYIHYYKPEFGFIGDDIAHERNPFLSLEMFQDIIAPYWKRYYDVFLEAGLPVGMHNCGHFELYLDDLVAMGCSFWDPVQSSNDAAAIKEKFGNDLALCGGLETRHWDEGTSEEEVRAAVRAYVDMLAPGGGFAMPEFYIMEGGMPGQSEDAKRRTGWIGDEFMKIRYDYY